MPNSIWLRLCLTFLFPALVLSGCSEMRFANLTEPSAKVDPREDVRLLDISTEMTSSGLTHQRVYGGEAIYSQASQVLTI